MGQSILREPPLGSELRDRADAFNALSLEDELDLSSASEEEKKTLQAYRELYSLREDRRVWKHSPQIIARHYLPSYLEAIGESGLAEECRHSEALATLWANDFQWRAYHEATANERSKEPPKYTKRMISLLVLAEFMGVRDTMPDAKPNRLHEITGKRLGAKGEPIDRAAIRRAEKYARCQLGGETPQNRDVVINGIIVLGKFFTIGWRDRLKASR